MSLIVCGWFVTYVQKLLMGITLIARQIKEYSLGASLMSDDRLSNNSS